VSDFEPFFSWAHLSDIHMGHGDAEHSWNQRIVLAALKEDIQRATNEYELTLNTIFVTGDLAFSGNVISTDEYERVGDWLRQVAGSVSVSNNSIFVIPGNHDVQRNVEVENESVDRLLKSLRCGDKLLDNALNDKAEQEMLTARMRNYLDFAKEFAPSKTGASSTKPQLFWTHYVDADVGLRIRLIVSGKLWVE
jgi:DNA repair exonuclease SbcCD nuclease subunit